MVFQDEKRKWHYYEDVDPLDLLALDEGIRQLRVPLILAIVYIIYVFSTL